MISKMKKFLLLFVCVVCFCDSDSRLLNTTHVDIQNETQIVYATSVIDFINSTSLTSVPKPKNLTENKNISQTNSTQTTARGSKSLHNRTPTKFYVDLPVNIPNNSDYNIDDFNSYPEDSLTAPSDLLRYILEPKAMETSQSNTNNNNSKYLDTLNNVYDAYHKKDGGLIGVKVKNQVGKKDVPHIRNNTRYPSFQYLPGTTDTDISTTALPKIKYGYPYVMQKQMEMLHTFKSVSESFFRMVYEIYFCVRYYWHQGVMKCMTGREWLFADRMFGLGDEDDLEEEKRDEVLREESLVMTSVTDNVEPEGQNKVTDEGEGEEEEARKIGNQGIQSDRPVYNAFSSGLGTGIGQGISHQVFTYQKPKKKKKKQKGGYSGHKMYNMLPYLIAAKAKILSLLAIVGFLAKKAWIVSTISLLLSTLGIFAKLSRGGGGHRKTEVILAKPSYKDWDWDKEWDRMSDGSESRTKSPTYHLVPVQEPTPIPLHLYEKDDPGKEYYMK